MFYADHRKHGLRHSPFKALVAPRPIAWVSSLSTEGVVNLAPYSFFNAMADSPPIIVFAPNNPRLGGGRKDTLENIEQTGEFVVNLCNWDLRLPMNESSAHVPPEVDEIELAGLTAAPSEIVKPPRVAEAPAALECEFLFRVRLPGSSPKIENNACFGRVVGVHISDDIIVDGHGGHDPLPPHRALRLHGLCAGRKRLLHGPPGRQSRSLRSPQTPGSGGVAGNP